MDNHYTKNRNLNEEYETIILYENTISFHHGYRHLGKTEIMMNEYLIVNITYNKG